MANGNNGGGHNGSGGSFMLGVMAGTVLGAGLAMLFAPKAGSELRSQLSEQAGELAKRAQEGYRKAREAASCCTEETERSAGGKTA
jgi:gas vesicle protein